MNAAVVGMSKKESLECSSDGAPTESEAFFSKKEKEKEMHSTGLASDTL